MGLPMFREPDEDDAQKIGAKVDRAAASRRSTIRRESTVRPRRYNTTTLFDEESRRRPYTRHERSNLIGDRRHGDDDVLRVEAELERLRRLRLRSQVMRNNTRSGRETEHNADSPERAGSSGISPSFSENGPAYPLPYPTRESALRFEVLPATSGSTSPRRYRTSTGLYIPSPPSSNGDGRVRSTSGGPLRILEDGPTELTPDFAPARGPYDDMPQPAERPNGVAVEHGNIDEDRPALETPPPESWEGSYPPLRRVGHLSPRPQLDSHDGLGDRRRSPTPSSPTSVTSDHWETLLTTMEDGDLLLGTAASFASRGLSDSASHSNRSSQTTATSFGEIGQGDDSCDLDLPHGITVEDVREIRQRHRGTVDQSVQLDNGPHRETLGANGSESGMSSFQSLLEEMARREDIPDEWWAAAGLTRTLRENA